MSKQPLVRWLTGSKPTTIKDRCSNRIQWSHETRVETSLTESFRGTGPLMHYNLSAGPGQPSRPLLVHIYLPRTPDLTRVCPQTHWWLNVFIPGETITLLSTSLLCLVEQFRFLLQDRLHLCDTASALPCRIMNFPLNSNNLDDSTHESISAGSWEVSPVFEQNWTAQQGLSIFTNHLSLCRLQEKVQGLLLVSAIL